MTNMIFAHGLESSPLGTKAIYLKEQFGAISPMLRHLGLKRQVDAIEALLADLGPAVLIGSSLGGLAALGAAVKCPQQVTHLFLLAPAVGTGQKKDAFKEAEKERPGMRKEVLEISALSIPNDVPATILHGLEDDVVDARDVLDLAVRSPSSRLILVHDDHPLSNSKDLILSIAGRAAKDQETLIA